MRARKLKSGSWRCRAFFVVNGKRTTKSFTASTKVQAELKANEYINSHRYNASDSSLQAALEHYVEIKSVLSPSTLASYNREIRYFTDIYTVKVSDLTDDIVSRWVDDFSITHSPKTVRNAVSLLQSATDRRYSVSLPQKRRPKYNVPSDKVVASLISYLKDTGQEDMLRAVYLAAYGMMRRSEICALTAEDINSEGMAHISKAKVKGVDNRYTVKTTKNVSSDRYVKLPQFVLDALPKSGEVVSSTPDCISRKLHRILNRMGVPAFRFHDLRHYSASVMHALNIPDQYIMERGGWHTDYVLKAVYRDTLDEYSKRFNDQVNSYFDKVATKVATDNKE